MQDLEKKLKARKIHPTAMRLLVLKELQNSEHAVSLNELENLFEQADKTTLYRTLKTFEKNKLVHSIEDGTGSVKYALCDETCECLPEETHIHFHCTNCGHTFCMKEVSLPKIQLPKKFKAEESSLVVKGLCDKCNA
ncbi:Fur family transcriptional regulator [Moheibacter lacus]|uniref:Transcriptional repressor n=1 Tax=Moheibacter lacus TaxID=2745851 RepID=A0A838ZS19_9FLAO|nr:transcriptional repressor [Moheibacter lacus]MBA5628799.1 transcriptional repressor [Moheibacter lacus]